MKASSLAAFPTMQGGLNKLCSNNHYRKSVWIFVLICSAWMIMMGSGVNAYRINFDNNHGSFTSDVAHGKLLDEYELGMYAREDLPLRVLTRPIANGDTFVQVYLNVKQSSIPTPDTKLVLVVASSEILATGFKKDQKNEYLCGDEGLVPTSQNTLDDDGILYYKYFSGDEVIDENFEVPLTGLYQYKLFYCPATSPTKQRPTSGEATFKLNGYIQFINPYGHLPGQYFFFLPFQAVMTIAYIVFAVLWFLASIFNRKEFLTLQFYITIVLMSCLAESLIVYFDYFLTNKIGSRNLIVQVCSMFMTVIRKTWTRLIILVVCSGYSSATKEEDDEPSENTPAQRKVTTTMIIIYAVIFAISCSVSEFGEFLFFRELITHTQYLITMVPTSLLDLFFYVWALYLLYNTMKMFRPSNPKAVSARERASQEWKQAVANNHYFYLYRRLMFAMIIYAWTVLIFLVLQFFYEYGQYYRSAWYLNWLFDSASYQIAFFAFFVLVGLLYRPAKHNSLYLHSEQLPTDELDADMMLKEGTGLEYQSDDSDEKDVEMMMMQNNEPLDEDEESESKENRKSQEKLVFSEDHETPTSSTPTVEKVETTTQQ